MNIKILQDIKGVKGVSCAVVRLFSWRLIQMLFSGELSSALNFRDRILRLSAVSSLPGLSQFAQSMQWLKNT